MQPLLANAFNSETKTEWRSRMTTGIYAPRLDLAVGPYSIADGETFYPQYDLMFKESTDVICLLTEHHLRNLGLITNDSTPDQVDQEIGNKINALRYFNPNSRCFLAVEIENNVSRKHLMGGAINASALGRIGIAIGYTERMQNVFANLFRYFAFLESVGKPTFHARNLLLVTPQQIVAALTPNNNQ